MLQFKLFAKLIALFNLYTDYQILTAFGNLLKHY